MQKELYALRKERRMNQQELADYLNISVQTYRKKEKGDAPFNQDEMFEIARLFRQNIDEIFLPRNHQNGDNKIA